MTILDFVNIRSNLIFAMEVNIQEKEVLVNFKISECTIVYA
jgi:hypothetical protein